MQVAVGQPSSISTISVSPVTFVVAQVFEHFDMSVFSASFCGQHSHDPPLNGSVSGLSLRI